MSPIAYGIPVALEQWVLTLAAAAIALVIVEALFYVGVRVVRSAAKRSAVAVTVTQAARAPAHWVFRLVALNIVWQEAPEGLVGHAAVQRWTGLLLIAVVTWLAVRCVNGASRAIIASHPATMADNLAARRLHTQTRAIAKTVVVLIVLVGVAMMLMTFPAVRQIGASLLASAGIVGIVAGFAARPVLGNMIAGLQIGITQPIRLDDVVIVQGEWGVIEEITGAYVVVRVWDQRRLVVPLQWWIENPFQNWTRTSSELIGTVFLWTDYRLPLAPLREALQAACRATPLWDGRLAMLQVVEGGERAMQLRCLVTAADASKAWDLRCHVREWLIDFIQREHPQYLPRLRAELAPQSPADQLHGAPMPGDQPVGTSLAGDGTVGAPPPA